jgi:hypothetical protein
VTRMGDIFQSVSAHVDVEVLSWPGGSLIADLLLLYARVRSKSLTGRPCPKYRLRAVLSATWRAYDVHRGA